MAAPNVVPHLDSQNASAAQWDVLPVAEALSRTDSRPEGLSSAEAAERLACFGPNTLPRKEAPPFWQIFLRQFQNPLIYVLAAAAIVSLVLDHAGDAVFIGLVLVVNAVIGGWQEWRAEQGAQALQKLLRVRASVKRDGRITRVDAEELVPGDVVRLESGDRVPADLRLLDTHGFEVDESLLTGESVPVQKNADWGTDTPVTVGDRLNMSHAGSFVVRGRATGLVVATASATEVGRIIKAVVGASTAQPPLLVRMERFVKFVAMAILGAAAVLAVVGLTVGHSLESMFFMAVALAVSAIPEGLPISLTVALAVAARRMAKRNVIVRRLAAVEGLGSCTMIASDKTGTLTCNELTVRELRLPGGERLDVTGEGFVPQGELRLDGNKVNAGTNEAVDHLVRAAALCNEGSLHEEAAGWAWQGDPTDVALLTLGRKHGWSRQALVDDAPQVGQIPFESERRFSGTYHRFPGGTRLFVKGAPERILSMCQVGGDEERTRWIELAESMARDGVRVLAVADGLREPPPPGSADEPEGLQFLGFIGMIDPLRPDAREAVEACHRAGIKVCMVTGDHPETALAISRDLGIARQRSEVITGAELGEADEKTFDRLVSRGRVFARMAAAQKKQIVASAQRLGHFVAVTGDGVNDGPALRAANIGISMGKEGTDVAREASDLVLTDDNFSSIVAGVEEGRIAYANVRKVVFLLVSTGVAEIVLLLLAIATGSPIPLLPAQLLWLNLVTNGIQDKALCLEPGENDVLARPPLDTRERIFNRLMIERTVITAGTMGVGGFVAFQWLLAAGWSVESARNMLLLLMVLFENVQIGNARSETTSAFSLSPLRNPWLLVGALAAQGIHIAAMYFPPLQRLLGTEPVTLAQWSGLAAVAVSVLVVGELHKIVLRRREKKITGAAAGAGAQFE